MEGLRVVAVMTQGILSGISDDAVKAVTCFSNAEWNSKSRCALVRVLDNTVNIYPSGKFVVMGAKDMEAAADSVSEVVGMYEAVGIPASVESHRIICTNMIWDGDITINLELLSRELENLGSWRSFYDPELGPKSLSISAEGISAIVNHSGSVLINSDEPVDWDEVSNICEFIARFEVA
ncbi:MAG: hypothetical protein IKQ60_00120 [Candidatus Methanomethylophilaceae archaeon]|nr:hypothetical protein [Candidatus Methanomethylophilaceae archaeon]